MKTRRLFWAVLLIGLQIDTATAATLEEGLAAFAKAEYDFAFAALEPLATLGDPQAQLYLGLMFEAGEGVAQSDYEAAQWYRRAAEQNNTTAQYNLGAMYRNGKGVPHDDRLAVHWYCRAANLGDPQAQVYLAIFYKSGRGLRSDDGMAVRLLRQAAAQGDPQAEFNLAEMYEAGRGVKRDQGEAISWYRKAADHGEAHAQAALGFAYAAGRGLPQDLILAHMWFNLAGSRFPPGQTEANERVARNLDAISAHMSGAQMAEAQQRARDWRQNDRQKSSVGPAKIECPGN